MIRAWQALVIFALLATFTGQSQAQSNSALPLSVAMDAGLSGNNKVEVSWTVLAKLSTDFFDVEKSHDGISWYSITVIKPDSAAAVPCNYIAFDLFPVKGANFYRIRMKDDAGRNHVYSNKNS